MCRDLEEYQKITQKVNGHIKTVLSRRKTSKIRLNIADVVENKS